MEESGSEGLDDLVFSLKDTFLKVLQSTIIIGLITKHDLSN